MLLLEHTQRNKGFQHPAIDVNRKRSSGGTPLYSAVYWERIEMIKLLLHHNDINVNIHHTFRGESALGMILNKVNKYRCAASREKEYIKNLLLAHGAWHEDSISEDDPGGCLSTNMAEGSQHATSSLVTGVRLAEASNEETERGNQATDVMDDLTDYEDDVDFEDTIFDEWMDFNNIYG